MNTLFDVKQAIRSMVGDEPADWTPDAYLVPKINFAYRTQTLYIRANAMGRNLEQVVEIPDAQDGNGNSTSVGRTSLAALQQQGQPLCGLVTPLYLWWKPAGAPEARYRQMDYKEPLPFSRLSTPQPWNGPAYWTWRGNTLFTTPIGFPYDLLVDGRFNPPPLVKDTDVLVVHPDMETAVVPGTIALMSAFDTGNAAALQAAVPLVEEAADCIVNTLITEKQGNTYRGGSNAWRMGMRGWFWA